MIAVDFDMQLYSVMEPMIRLTLSVRVSLEASLAEHYWPCENI